VALPPGKSDAGEARSCQPEGGKRGAISSKKRLLNDLSLYEGKKLGPYGKRPRLMNAKGKEQAFKDIPGFSLKIQMCQKMMCIQPVNVGTLVG